MDPAIGQSGDQGNHPGTSPGMFPLSLLNVGIDIPWEGGPSKVYQKVIPPPALTILSHRKRLSQAPTNEASIIFTAKTNVFKSPLSRTNVPSSKPDRKNVPL